MPVPVITRLQGGVTGGSAGLVFAADLVAMDRAAFIQPYYSEMGFGPDGGWTALLRERITPAKAFAIQALNRRISADEALELGLADRLSAREELDDVVGQWLDALSVKSVGSVKATKRLLRSDSAIARMGTLLDAERREFLELIAQPDTARRMEAFLGA
jgi:2-(1,2-epoxy-1,2-dihydrophenyl)acetyl-CoA isomerase